MLFGDCRKTLAQLEQNSVDCCVTSPPYWGLRDYGHADQIGLEPTPEAYVEALVKVFALVRRALKPDGTLWLNIGDSYAAAAGGGQGKNSAFSTRAVCKAGARRTRSKVASGLKPKDVVGIPWMLAFALRADGWTLRAEIIWHKPNPIPESVADRPTKAHEYVFLLSKSRRYHYDGAAIAERATGRAPGNSNEHKYATAYSAGDERHRTKAGMSKIGAREARNARSVWTLPTQPYSGAHFAVMPPALAKRCILAGCRPGGVVLDPFLGSGTVASIAEELGRYWIGCELTPEYAPLIAERTAQVGLMLPEAGHG